MGERATDPGTSREWYRHFGNVAWVHCPQCDGPAREASGRLTCIRCGYNQGAKDYEPKAGMPYPRPGRYEPLKPYLSRSVVGHTLWVHNLAHLDALAEWLGADLRERGARPGLTMMARLPGWMKAASARTRVLKALADLRAQAEREGLD